MRAIADQLPQHSWHQQRAVKRLRTCPEAFESLDASETDFTQSGLQEEHVPGADAMLGHSWPCSHAGTCLLGFLHTMLCHAKVSAGVLV